MKKNLGNADRIVRVIAGLAVLGLGFQQQSYWGLLGLIPLVTGAVGFCPAYCPLGIRTCKISAK